MKSVGIVVEYNPLHNGHLYHLNESKKAANADCVIAVMSGQFLQRGEPAIVPKNIRTKMALQAGADLVIELPYAFSAQHATYFAKGAVSILHSLECSALCFGSEDGDINRFTKFLDHKKRQQSLIDQEVKQMISQGMSYPTAYSKALSQVIGLQDEFDITRPNNILGIQYIEAIDYFNSSMKPLTIKRIAADYHDETIDHTSIASATAIRKVLSTNNQEIYNQYVPSFTSLELNKYLQTTNLFHSWEAYFHLLKYKCLTASAYELNNIYEAVEGLELRILQKIKQASSFEQLMNEVKTKRYTWTRIQRLLTHILTNTSKDQMSEYLNDGHVPYIRLLGMTEKGKEYIRLKKKNLSIPIYHNVNQQNQHDLLLDVKSTNTYASVLSSGLQNDLMKTEFAQYPILYQSNSNSFLKV
jgi:predicted nucleotidyltransferase